MHIVVVAKLFCPRCEERSQLLEDETTMPSRQSRGFGWFPYSWWFFYPLPIGGRWRWKTGKPSPTRWRWSSMSWRLSIRSWKTRLVVFKNTKKFKKTKKADWWFRLRRRRRRTRGSLHRRKIWTESRSDWTRSLTSSLQRTGFFTTGSESHLLLTGTWRAPCWKRKGTEKSIEKSLRSLLFLRL